MFKFDALTEVTQYFELLVLVSLQWIEKIRMLRPTHNWGSWIFYQDFRGNRQFKLSLKLLNHFLLNRGIFMTKHEFKTTAEQVNINSSWCRFLIPRGVWLRDFDIDIFMKLSLYPSSSQRKAASPLLVTLSPALALSPRSMSGRVQTLALIGQLRAIPGLSLDTALTRPEQGQFKSQSFSVGYWLSAW